MPHVRFRERNLVSLKLRPAAFGVVLLLCCVLAGCGSSEDEASSASSSNEAPAENGQWSYVSGDGKTYTADETPKRIIAHAYSAAALMEFGIKPVGVYADGPIKDDVGLKGVDFTGVEILGETWGEIDVEKAATLRPDLIVGDWWPAEKAYSGMEGGVKERSKKIAELAQVVGPSQGDSIVELIQGYEKLAETLGGDTSAGGAREDFDKAVERFEAATAANKGLTALAISPYDQDYAVAVPKYAPELLDFQRWGLDVMVPKKPDPEFPYWQTLSFEEVDTYQADLLMFDDRNYPGNFKTLEKAPTADRIKAFKAGAYTTWPAYWLHRYSDYADELNRLAEVIEGADPGVA
jgi:iron complex transport system substrate-binding protein